MEAPCSVWKRSGPKAFKLDTKIILRGNPVQGVISDGTIGDVLEKNVKTNRLGGVGRHQRPLLTLLNGGLIMRV